MSDTAISKTELANAYEMLCLGCADEAEQRIVAEAVKIDTDRITELETELAEAKQRVAELTSYADELNYRLEKAEEAGNE